MPKTVSNLQDSWLSVTGRRHNRPITSRLIYTPPACHIVPTGLLATVLCTGRLNVSTSQLHACRVPAKVWVTPKSQVAGRDLWRCRLWWGAVARPRQAGPDSRGRFQSGSGGGNADHLEFTPGFDRDFPLACAAQDVCRVGLSEMEHAGSAAAYRHYAISERVAHL